MKREDLTELHYITPIENVASILQHGILSHNRAEKIRHVSVAQPEIQDGRKGKKVPDGANGRWLHDYVNLYVYARNAMLFKRRPQHEMLCVLRLSTAVLDLPNVVIADQNASSDHVRFGASPGTLSRINKEMLFAESWTHPDDLPEEWRHKSAKCAEVLVPDRFAPNHIIGARVSCLRAQKALTITAPSLEIVVDAHLFFLG